MLEDLSHDTFHTNITENLFHEVNQLYICLMGVMKNYITRNLTSMKKNGLVSIIIPVLNEETSIGKILDLLKTEFNEKYEIFQLWFTFNHIINIISNFLISLSK